MLTLYLDSIFVGAFIGWFRLVIVKTYMTTLGKREKTKRLNLIPSNSAALKINTYITVTQKLKKRVREMNEGMAIDHFYKHQLNAYLDSEEDKQPIVDYQGETLDAAREIVYRLESSSKLYVFDQDNAVEFLDLLKGQYKDAHQLLKDFGLDIDDLFYAIEDSEFSIDCTMDFLLFLSAEKAEAE